MGELVAAVDVGTLSARAGIFDLSGRAVAIADAPLAIRYPAPGQGEQDSASIWRAVCDALRAARDAAGARPDHVCGLAFDATCSLVLRDRAHRPLSLPGDGAGSWDTIAWFDHRAEREAVLATGAGRRILDWFGGGMSPEMQIPKLMWLKRNAPDLWSRLGFAYDLADYLGWRATGSNGRSVCTLGCKWGFLPQEKPHWPEDFFAAIDLADFLPRTGVPEEALAVASRLGDLTPRAAEDLGLAVGTPVATGLIDAHAGALGALGRDAEKPERLERQVALIAGTSSCLMAFSRAPIFAPTIWGPSRDSVFEGLWLREGGQSASGALLDHLCHLWTGEPATPALHGRICAQIADMRRDSDWLAADLHVLPDFHGNRSPFGDASLRGMIAGLDLERSFASLARVYWRAAVALALGLRQILGRMASGGAPTAAIHLAGGHAQSPILPELYAGACALPVHVPQTPNAMLLGGGMAAATGAGRFPSLPAAAAAMAQPAVVWSPKPALAPWLERDFRILVEMQAHRARLREISGLSPDAFSEGRLP